MRNDVVHKMIEEYYAWRALKGASNNRGKGINARSMHEGVFVPTALYGTDAWGLRSAEKKSECS